MNKNLILNEVKEKVNSNDINILALYMYGSHVYETNTKDSDSDFILVSNTNIDEVKLSDLIDDLKVKNIDITVYNENDFKDKINAHEISLLECLWLSEDKKYENEKFNIDFILDKTKLRSSFSEKASNSWVKAKKKFIVEKDFNPKVGKKSAWHSLRILDFGTQIAKFGKIVDYKSMNEIYTNFMSCESWEKINEKFKSLYNQKSSDFKLVAPKAEIENTTKLKL